MIHVFPEWFENVPKSSGMLQQKQENQTFTTKEMFNNFPFISQNF